jgi:hypothetical protein
VARASVLLQCIEAHTSGRNHSNNLDYKNTANHYLYSTPLFLLS